MLKKILSLFLVIPLACISLSCIAGSKPIDISPPSFYAGVLGGFGSTTWKGLRPTLDNQNLAIMMSTPIEVKEGGNIWGFIAGYELSPYFSIEGSYIHYPEAKVFFDSMSLFSFNNDGQLEFKTQTESLSLMGKIMLILPDSSLRLYSSAGVAEVHRKDMLLHQWLVSPTFGAGLNHRLSTHFMSELGANYIAGFGESQLNPTETYIPFLYSVSLRLAYIF